METLVVSARLMETRLKGTFDTKMADWLVAQFEDWLPMGGQAMSVFHDWEAGDDFDSDVRQKLTEWSNRHRSRFEHVHILVVSKTAMWAIRIYNTVTGGITSTYTDREAFEAVRDQARTMLR